MPPVPGIFAIKVESCQNSRRNFDVYLALPNFRGRPSKSYTHVMTPAYRHVVWKMFCGDTPTSPEVIVANTLNYKPNFKFSRFFSILDIWSRFGDIRDQSRKLSKIAKNFGRFFASQISGGRPSKRYTHVMTPVPRHVVRKMFCGDTPTSPEVIVVVYEHGGTGSLLICAL